MLWSSSSSRSSRRGERTDESHAKGPRRPQCLQYDVGPVSRAGDAQKKEDALMTEMFKHSYQLRLDLGIEVELPEDLTMEDVTRMSGWLRTLPFDLVEERMASEGPRDKRKRGEGKRLEIEDVAAELHAIANASPAVLMEAMKIESLGEILAQGATDIQDKWLRAVAFGSKLQDKLDAQEKISEGAKELLDQVVLESHVLLQKLIHTDECNLDGSGSCATHRWDGMDVRYALSSCPHPRGSEFLKELGKMVAEIESEKTSDDSGG